MSHWLSVRVIRDFSNCTDVSLACPVEATTLGYVPNLGSNVFFTVMFKLCFIAALGLGIWKRTWSYCVAISLGTFLECIGYIGRIMMHPNVWDKTGFKIQICCIILGPTFLCAAIYLTLKHISLALNPDISRIRPKLYPIVFLPADISCLVVQAIGGGVAAGAGTDKSKADTGNQIIMAGVVLQVVVLVAFGLVAADYIFRVRKYVHEAPGSEGAQVWKDAKFIQFFRALIAAYTLILIRCVYRIIEMAGGWGNHIMQDEPSFLVLDGALVLISSIILTVVHPGIYFPQMRSDKSQDDIEMDKRSDISPQVLVQSLQ